jgi:hypothetical protein
VAAYDYYVVPFIGRIKNEGDNPKTVSEQLQSVIDHYVEHGWEFYSIEKVGIEVQPGCIGALLGHSPSYVNFDQIIFRRQT